MHAFGGSTTKLKRSGSSAFVVGLLLVRCWVGCGFVLPLKKSAAFFSVRDDGHSLSRRVRRSPTSRLHAQESESSSGSESEGKIDVSIDERLYRVRLPRAPGIEWGTDLSFQFVYVRAMEPAGPASLSGLVEKGDQLCELCPVGGGSSQAVNLLGAPFDYVMDNFANIERNIKEVELVFFRGTRDDLKALVTGKGGGDEPETITITVVQNKGAANEATRTLQAPVGVNVRKICVDNKINVYQSVTRWTNCKGKQLCGTCIVNVTKGAMNTNRKSLDEESTLRENPDSYRLSCVTFAYGDITVETFPPVGAAQWTR